MRERRRRAAPEHSAVRKQLHQLWHDPPLVVVVLAASAAVVIGVVTAWTGTGWGRGDLKTWDTWLSVVQALTTIVAVAGGAYIAYRRLIGGGGVLSARCTLGLAAELHTFEGDHVQAIIVECTVENEGSLDFELLGEALPFVSVKALSLAALLAAQTSGRYEWSSGRDLIGLPFRDITGARDHDTVEPGAIIRSSIVVPVPDDGGPYQAFWVRFVVEGRSAGESGDEWQWIADTIVLDSKARADTAAVGERS